MDLNRISSSSGKITNQTTVCPNETLFIQCSTKSVLGLVWTLPSKDGLQRISYYHGDPIHISKRVGSIIVWLEDNYRYLTSITMIPYSPKLKETIITCESGRIRKSLPYILAGKAV